MFTANIMDINLFKYPKTPHLPWSECLQDDDIYGDISSLENKEVVVTLKLDGENINFYNNYIHARSLEPLYQSPATAWIKSFHASIKWKIPNYYKLSGENVAAKHSIEYKDLESYFFLFSVWHGLNCLSWNETLEWSKKLDICTVPVIYEGKFDKYLIHNEFINYNHSNNEKEGYVVRNKDDFDLSDFKLNCFKYVRKYHIKTSKFWRNLPTVFNGLKI